MTVAAQKEDEDMA